MPKIKLTKSELKSQRDSLRQFSRFLPTLQLKKQQLQLETRKCQDAMEKLSGEKNKFISDLKSWIAVFGSADSTKNITSLLSVAAINTSVNNIAGVDVPVFESIEFKTVQYSLFEEDPWLDDAIAAVKKLVELKTRDKILNEQYDRIASELRTTTQRVNLFEKVKIPESKENIRVIQIYLGDQDTAGVARAKIAKSKMQGTA